MRSFNPRNLTALPPPRTLRHAPPSTTSKRPPIRTNRPPPAQTEPVHLRKRKEAPPIHKEIILPKSRLGTHRRRSMSHHLQHMIAPHRPRKINHGTPRITIMNLLSIRQYQPLTRSHAPHHGNVVFLAAACRAGFARGEGVGVGKAEAPADAAFGVGDAFAAGYGCEVYGVEGAVGAGAGGHGCWGGEAGRGWFVGDSRCCRRMCL